jgi:2-dehydropantoate 2-reductase
MKITIVGVGGVGGYFGGKLAWAGHDVTFVARGKNYKEIKSKGLKIKSINGDFHVKNVQVVEQLSEIGETDLLILGVKAWQVKSIAKELKKRIQKDTIILPLQNGVLISEELLTEIDSSHVLGGLCRILSELEAPGVIKHSGVKPEIIFGELDNTVSERVVKLHELFNSAEISSVIAENIHSEIWRKFIETCVSGVLVVTDSSLGSVLEVKESRDMMRKMLQEIYTVSQAAGVVLEENCVDKMMTFFSTFPYDTTFSLTRDVRAGRPSEIDFQCGLVAKLGEEFGISTPINKFIYQSIIPKDLQARKMHCKTPIALHIP